MYLENVTCDGCDDENVTCVRVGDQCLCADCCRINEELAEEFCDDDDISMCDEDDDEDVGVGYEYDPGEYEPSDEDDIYADDRYNVSDAYDEW